MNQNISITSLLLPFLAAACTESGNGQAQGRGVDAVGKGHADGTLAAADAGEQGDLAGLDGAPTDGSDGDKFAYTFVVDGGTVTFSPIIDPADGGVVKSWNDPYIDQLLLKTDVTYEDPDLNSAMQDPDAQRALAETASALPWMGRAAVQGTSIPCDHEPGTSTPLPPPYVFNFPVGVNLDLTQWFLIPALQDPTFYGGPIDYDMAVQQELRAAPTGQATVVLPLTHWPLDWTFLQTYMGAHVGQPFWICFGTNYTTTVPSNGAQFEYFRQRAGATDLENPNGWSMLRAFVNTFAVSLP